MTAANIAETANKVHEQVQERPVFLPDADIYETKEAIHLALNVPGVQEKDIDVSLEDDALAITAPQSGSEPEGMTKIHAGFRTGVFKRSFSIVADIDKAKIAAKLSNGVLRLTLPKSEKAKPRKIEVKAS